MPLITLVCADSIDDGGSSEALRIIAERLGKEFPEEDRTFILRRESIPQEDFILLKGGQILNEHWSPVIKVVISERNSHGFTVHLLKTLAQAAAEALKVNTAEVTVYAERLGSGCFYVNNTLV